MSPPPLASSRSRRSTTNSRTFGSTASTWRGVNPRATSLRNSVCTGGSCITIGGLSLQANHFQVAVVDRQAFRRRERLVVARRGPDVGVPGQHVVVVVGLV